jgi:hypothetical protein
LRIIIIEAKGRNEQYLESNHQGFWLKIDLGIQWFNPIKRVQEAVSSSSFPLSGYLPLVQALRNAFNVTLQKSKEMDNLFGAGTSKELADFVRSRFNMDGKDPTSTRRVGLLSEHHIWAHISHGRSLP